MSTSVKSNDQELTRYRWLIALRIFLAVAGGYLVTSQLIVVLSYILPLSKSDAVVTASLLSFALFCSVIVWVFSVKSVRQIGLGLLVSAISLQALILALKFFGGGQ